MQVKKDYTHNLIVTVTRQVFLKILHYVIDDVGDCNELMATQVHVMLGYDYFHATRGLFSVYRKNSETWFKLKYSF